MYDWNVRRAEWMLMAGPYATGAGELRQDRKVAAVSHVYPGAVGQPGLSPFGACSPGVAVN